MLKPTLPLLLTATAFPALAQIPAFSAARVSADIKILASDDYEGRAPATPGETKTVAYIIAQLKAAGLQPGGSPVASKRGWTQDVPLLQTSIIGTPAIALNTNNATYSLTQGQEIAIRAALNGATSVAVADAPLVFVGYGVKAPERNWDDFKGVDLRGKIMVVLVNDPDFETGTGDFGGKAMTYYGRWTYKYEEAARQGALGCLVIHETAPASYGWATVKNSNTALMFDIVRTDPKAVHPALEGWIQRDLAIEMFKASGLDFDTLKKQAQSRDFKPVTLTPTLNVAYQVDSKTVVSHNVAGILPGARYPQETVIYSGHWDHLGIGPPDAKGDRINNGALDNASGIGFLLEEARAFANGPRPDRSIVFLAVTAEERGLLGSAYYAANPLYPAATTVGVINMDEIIGASAARDFTISGSAKLGLLDLLIADGTKLGRTYTPDPHPEGGSFYRSDHFSFAKAGIPAISFEAGEDLFDGGTAKGSAWKKAFDADRYHQPADEWSADWNLTSVVPDLTLLYTVGHDLAFSRQWPAWSADSEFKAARDVTAAQRK